MKLRYNGGPVHASIDLPGSKSISNRLLVLKEVLSANTQLLNISDSKDTQDLVKAIQTVKCATTNVIDIGPAGTSMRFLTAFLSTQKGEWILTGSERMKERPINALVEALRQIGANITYTEKEGYPPLLIKGQTLKGGTIEIDGSISSQFISALLLSSPLFEADTRIALKNNIVSWPYIKMTLALMKEFDVQSEVKDNTIHVFKNAAGHFPVPLSFSIEADWSSASYWYSVSALCKNAVIKLKGLRKDSLQGDSVLLSLYKQLGVTSTFSEDILILENFSSPVSRFEHDFSECPDIAQTIAVTCLGLNIPCYLTGLSTLKHKETDRIQALKNELEKFNASVNITGSSLEVKPGEIRGEEMIEIETYKDHRMAMSFAPLAFLCPLDIKKPEVVEKSYPSFWNHLKSAGINLD